ncbi:MBL fold metallo-hydrolase [Marinivivus vitaminiproducens]|uniref:MBL fold metallo-hydrolase n=1 Tax=Marinivivus vitaminiproducens TaxID=3035935 RepID=UPI00279C90B0|nr:MBL fold metallo-hydrolase [Geminicoccaceae bacterium SCSIO 64248]
MQFDPDGPILPARESVPAGGEAVAIAPGVLWIRLRLPFALNHVNVWAVEDGPGWALIDTGIADEPTRALWPELLAGALGGRPVTRVIATHFHPDHMGMAGALCRMTGAPLSTSAIEWTTARLLAQEPPEEQLAAMLAHYRRCGMPDELLEAARQRSGFYRKRVTLPPPVYDVLGAGDRITIGGRAWQVRIGRGHAPEMITLYAEDGRILISADHVLPTISPNVSVWASSPEADPLGHFLETLGIFDDLPEDVLVLPGHGRPFQGLHSRIGQLRRHHDERLDVLTDRKVEHMTAADAMRVLFSRELDMQQIGFALGETLAHLNRLRRMGRIERTTDEDGLYRFRVT